MQSKQKEQFWNSLAKAETLILATSGAEGVSMRTVAPVYYDGAVLIFTDPSSQKYQQLKKNPRCCLALGNCFLEAEAQFSGATMAASALKKVYEARYPGAFDENVPNNGREAEFILFKPKMLRGWAMENGDLWKGAKESQPCPWRLP